MTLYLDTHEAEEMETLLSQLAPVERAYLNPERPDAWWLDCAGREVGWENKQSGELLGSLSDVEEQLMREVEGVDYLGLTVRGLITPTLDGYCQTWKPAKANPRIYIADQFYRTRYSAYAEWTVRLERAGIVVKEAGDLAGLCIMLAADYKNGQKDASEHRTMKQIIHVKQYLAELDPAKAKFAKQLMAVCDGVGEEIALSLSDHFTSIVTLINTLESGAEKEIAGLKLRNGKRTVGPSVVARMKGALGLP